jgi:uncharacterized protein YbcC (UPF0753/DUF2309 family)
MFLHHPTYHIESYAKNPNFLFKGVINTDFVKKYYNGKSLNNELEKKLLNENYKIFFPDLLEFTKELCVEFEKLFEIINSNDDHIEKLQLFRKKTI